MRASTLLAAIALCSAALARAQGPAGEVVWRCGYEPDGKFRLTCVRTAGVLADAKADPDSMMYIPIYTHPFGDFSFARRLARAAMCGPRPGCTVTFEPPLMSVDGRLAESAAPR